MACGGIERASPASTHIHVSPFPLVQAQIIRYQANERMAQRLESMSNVRDAVSCLVTSFGVPTLWQRRGRLDIN
jgi:hypothetical protein